MSRISLVALFAALTPAACGVTPPPDTAVVPPAAFGGLLGPDVAAMNLAAYAFGDASRTYGNPAEAARALAALDYMAGEINTNPRWSGISALAQVNMLRARVTMRRAMGIDLSAPSQVVVNSLLAASAAFAAGNTAQAAAILHPPAFPADIVQRLSNMPYIASVNAATTEAGDDLTSFPSEGGIAP
jgi:hypothetical protein